MNAGEMNRLVDVLEAIDVRTEASGEIVREWVSVRRLWAKVEDMSVRERFLAQQVYPDLDARVTVRWRDDIDPAYRLREGNRLFEILGPPLDPDGGRQWLQLNCRTVREGV